MGFSVSMVHFEVKREKFEHFLAGDGEWFFDNNDGEFISRAELEQAFINNDCKTEQEKKDYMTEYSICKSYDDLEMELDYYYDGLYALDYLIFGHTAVMNIASAD